MSRPLSPLDSSFWFIDTETTHQCISSCCVIDAVPELSEVRARAEEMLTDFPRMAEKVTGGRNPRWERDQDFDLDNHIGATYLPEIDSTQSLFDGIAETFSDGLDLNRPLWRVWLVSNRKPNEKSDRPVFAALNFFIHHAFADGLGGLRWVECFCASSRPRGSSPTTEISSDRGAPLHRAASILRLMWENCIPRPRSIVNGTTNTSTRRIAVTAFRINELREVKRATGATVNDVVLAIVAGAMRRFHLERGQRVGNLKAIVPVNRRRLAQMYTLGNELTGVGVSLPSGLSSPLARLERIHVSLRRLKRTGAVEAYSLLARFAALLPRFLQIRFLEIPGRRANFICTNVPFFPVAKTLFGANVTASYGVAALMRDQGIAFCFVSYAGRLHVSVASDPAIVPDPGAIVKYLEEEAVILLTAARTLSQKAPVEDKRTVA